MMEHVMGRVKLASGWNTRGMCLHGTSTAVQLYPRHENIAEKGAGTETDGRYIIQYDTSPSHPFTRVRGTPTPPVTRTPPYM